MQMWKQLGLRAVSAAGTEDGAKSIAIELQREIDEPPVRAQQSSIYDLCYQTPPKDVSPPRGIDVVDLNAIKVSLLLKHKSKPRKRARKRAKTEEVDIFEDSEDEDMLFSSQSQQQPLTDTDAILAILDATLRLNIAGDLTRGRPLMKGLSARFLEKPSSLSAMAPAVFAPKDLSTIATRAALLPTVAHALSASLYTRTKSLSLSTKLQKLIEPEPLAPDSGGQAVRNNNTLDSSKRFEAVSAKLWRFLQERTRSKHTAPKLPALTSREPDGAIEAAEDEDLFAPQAHDDYEDDDANDFDLFATQEGEGDEFELLVDDNEDEEDLFADEETTSDDTRARPEHPQGPLADNLWLKGMNDLLWEVSGNDEDLFTDLARAMNEPSSMATSGHGSPSVTMIFSHGTAYPDSPGCYHDPAMFDDIDEEVDDDLLLDLMLDERMSDE